uniref:Uncharacterized protein n=1 Tax=Anguilla anguilla TaxID=7936 RepID=A0A0E9VV16_ANGAN
MLLHYVACSYYTIYNGALVKKSTFKCFTMEKMHFICFGVVRIGFGSLDIIDTP